MDKKNKNSLEPSSDSLSIYLTSAKNANYTLDQRFKFNQKAFSILENKKNDSLTRANLYQVATSFQVLGESDELRKSLKIILEHSMEKGDTINLAKTYNLLGIHNLNLGQNDSAYYYLLKSENFFIKLKDSSSLCRNYIDKAFAKLYVSDYSGCEASAIKALEFSKNAKIGNKIYEAYNLIGICSNELKNYNNALIYHAKAYNAVKEFNLPLEYHLGANSLNNIGVVYQYQNKHKEAISQFKLALQEKDLLKDSPASYAMITDNLAYSKFKLKDYNGLPEQFFQALKIREENKLESGIISNKIHLSEYYAERKDTLNSQKFANEALQLAKTTKVSGDLLLSLKQISLVEHKNSAKYSKEYIRISDSIQQEERIAKDKFARIAFETDEIIGEKDQLEVQNRNLFYLFTGLLSLGVLLSVIRIQRSRNRVLLLKQQQQKANEEIYNLMMSQQAVIEENRVKEKKRIAQELHDGVLGRMFGVRLNLDSLNRFEDEESVKNRLTYLNELKSIEQDIREISHDLNREKKELINNFVAIVHNLIEEQKSSFEPNVKFKMDEEINWDKKNNATKINLYRILQESLQNINKYAKAKNIIVEFKKDIDNIILKIVDDGIGFELNGRKKGIGLQNMTSRVNDCGGIFDISSKKGEGTTILVTIPIEQNTIKL